MQVDPLKPGEGLQFEGKIAGGVIPREFIPAVEKGVREAAGSGVLAGYPVVDVKVKLVDGSYHEVASSDMAFKIAGSMAFKEAVRQGDPILLEPIMQVDVVAPEEYLGEVIGDLNARRGRGIGGDMQAPAPRGGRGRRTGGSARAGSRCRRASPKRSSAGSSAGARRRRGGRNWAWPSKNSHGPRSTSTSGPSATSTMPRRPSRPPPPSVCTPRTPRSSSSPSTRSTRPRRRRSGGSPSPSPTPRTTRPSATTPTSTAPATSTTSRT